MIQHEGSTAARLCSQHWVRQEAGVRSQLATVVEVNSRQGRVPCRVLWTLMARVNKRASG